MIPAPSILIQTSMTAMQTNRPDDDRTENQKAPDWDDTAELESDETDGSNSTWWGQTQIAAAIRAARRQRVDPRKVFDGTRGEDKAKTLNFPEMVESKSPPRASLFSRVVQKVFRKK